MEKADRVYRKKSESSVKNNFKAPVIPLPRPRHTGDEKGMQESRIQRIDPAEDEEGEEVDRLSDHFFNSRMVCAACHLAVSSTNLRDNNLHHEQALACSQGHLLCHRCVQRYAIRSDVGCLLCAAESQNSPTCSRLSSSNPSLENVRNRAFGFQEKNVQQKKAEEIYANPRSDYPQSLPIAATRMPCYSGLNRADSLSDWNAEHADSRDHPIYDSRQFQQKSNCSIIKKDELEASNSEMRVNGQTVSECSRRPIRCPRLDCSLTVALSALTHHFLFDHPEVPILSVEPEAKNSLIVSFSALTYGSTKCLALLLVSGKLSGAAANLFNGSQIHSKYRNRLPLPVLAARLKCTNQYGTPDEISAGGESHDRGDLIIAWVAGPDFTNPASGSLRCSIQVVDGLESDVYRSLTYSGPINSLRRAQRPHEIFLAGDCVVLHEGLMNQISFGCTSLIVNVIIH